MLDPESPPRPTGERRAARRPGFNSAVLRISAESRNFSFGTRGVVGSSPPLDEGGSEGEGARFTLNRRRDGATRFPFMTDERTK